MPKKKPGESKDEFISRCISTVIGDGTAQDEKQAYAICIQKAEEFEKCVELVINDHEESGVRAISLVEFPAIEVDYMYFSKNKLVLSKIDDEKKIVIGPALIPNKKIDRINEKGEMYQVYFSEDTVRKISEKYLMQHLQEKATLEHEKEVEGLCLIESWIVEDPKNDKSNALGFELEKGTWMVSMKLDDKTAEMVKNGKINGYSIEGYFGNMCKCCNVVINEDIEITDELLIDEITEALMTQIELTRQDNTLNKLKYLQKLGYDEVTWITSDSEYAQKDICKSLNNNNWKLNDFLMGLNHDAPIFEHSHVQCLCKIKVTGYKAKRYPMYLDWKG